MMRRAVTATVAGLMMATAPNVAWSRPQAAAAAQVRLDPARIDRALEQMVASGRVAGTSVLVWKDGREAYFGYAGFADREAKRPYARDTIVQIWSMTKPVTGVALMQLWETGKLQLDAPLARYLPEFATMLVQDGSDATGKPLWRPAKRAITVRDLLRHTAGLAYGGGPSAAEAAFAAADPLAIDHDLAEFGRRIARVPLIADPGERWAYSAAVDVQALLVERLSGMVYADYVQQRILDPLKMRETGWKQPLDRLPRLAATYRRDNGGPLTRQDDALTRRMNFPGAALTMGGAGLAAPIDDYMRFARMLLNGGELDGARILKASTVRLMATDQLDPAITERGFLPGKGNVGFGFDLAVRRGPPLTAQENRGAIGEFFWDGAASTLFWVDPANRMAVVFFTQAMPFDGTLHTDIRRAVYGDAYLGPSG